MFQCEHGTKYYESFDAQRYCGVSHQTLRKMAREGYLLDSGKVGVGYVYTKAQLDSAMYEYGTSRKDVNVEVIHA
jgi:hypothetical protein